MTIALVVGTLLFAINQLDVVLRGDATAVVWIKAAVTYVVPFCVANAGVLTASRDVTSGPRPDEISGHRPDEISGHRPGPGV